MIQRDILRSGGGGPYASPEWLIEGTAEYGENLYRAALPYEIALQRGVLDTERAWTLSLVNATSPFRDIARSFRSQHYRIAAAAISWLVEASGNPHAHLEYWRGLASDPAGWRGAFASAFGLTVGEFFDRLEEHQAELSEDIPRIRGRMIDLKGAPLPGVYIQAQCGCPSDSSICRRSITFPTMPTISIGLRCLLHNSVSLSPVSTSGAPLTPCRRRPPRRARPSETARRRRGRGGAGGDRGEGRARTPERPARPRGAAAILRPCAASRRGGGRCASCGSGARSSRARSP